MGNFDGVLICTDLDGTLFRNDKSVSKENLDAIEYFKSEGGKFTFITGRMPYFSKDIYDIVKPNVPVGCINGAGIYDFENNRYLYTVALDPSVLDLVQRADENLKDTGIQVNTFERIYFYKDNIAMREFRKITKMPDIRAHYRDICEPIAKIVFCDHIEDNIKKLEHLLLSHELADNFHFIRSEQCLYEILPKGLNKGTVLEKMTELFGVDKNKTVAIGDFNNDIEMIKSAKVGIAVANARPEVKKVADFVTVSNEESAIAKVIEDIDRGRINFKK